MQKASLTKYNDLLNELRSIESRAIGVPRAGRWTWEILRDIGTGTLETLLRDDIPLREFTAEMFRAGGMGTSRLSLSALCSWLVFRTLDIGAAQALADLQRYVESPKFLMRFALVYVGCLFRSL